MHSASSFTDDSSGSDQTTVENIVATCEPLARMMPTLSRIQVVYLFARSFMHGAIFGLNLEQGTWHMQLNTVHSAKLRRDPGTTDPLA